MAKMVPTSRPQQTREQTEMILAQNLISGIDRVTLVAVRGYYLDSMGVKGENDIGVFDDAMFVISPDTYQSFNANTDPQKAGLKKAMLAAPQKIPYYKGKHKGKYNALRPFPEGVRLPCTRDGVTSLCSHTNIHKGGFYDTFSEGCITIFPTQYDEFIKLVYAQMTKYDQKTVMLLLVENKGA